MDLDGDGNEDGQQHQRHSGGGSDAEHLARRYLGADKASDESPHKHQQPVEAGDRGGHVVVVKSVLHQVEVGVLEPLVKDVGGAHLDAHIDKDCYGTEYEVAVVKEIAEREFLGGLS